MVDSCLSLTYFVQRFVIETRSKSYSKKTENYWEASEISLLNQTY
jgi:hypothetical protein